jgi:hypothetical protein
MWGATDGMRNVRAARAVDHRDDRARHTHFAHTGPANKTCDENRDS